MLTQFQDLSQFSNNRRGGQIHRMKDPGAVLWLPREASTSLLLWWGGSEAHTRRPSKVKLHLGCGGDYFDRWWWWCLSPEYGWNLQIWQEMAAKNPGMKPWTKESGGTITLRTAKSQHWIYWKRWCTSDQRRAWCSERWMVKWWSLWTALFCCRGHLTQVKCSGCCIWWIHGCK